MTHLEIENLASDYLEGLLDAATRTAMEAHLADCAPCRELLGDVRHALELCRTTEQVEPTPWLISKILLATVGERKPTWREQVAAFFRPVVQPRVAYPIAMTVFTFSIIVNAAGLNLRHLQIKDLNPRTWIYRASQQGHLAFASVEKYYYDLRVVYEIESRFRQLSGEQPASEQEAPKPATPGGGSSMSAPADQTEASAAIPLLEVAAGNVQALPAVDSPAVLTRADRSPIR
jgi:hypothetical protein